MALEKLVKNAITLTLDYDDCADESPREYEVSTLFGFHNRVVSPDPAPDSDPETARSIAEDPKNICVPVYMYDHGARIYKASTEGNPFSCPWDSGLFGFIYISRADARQLHALSRITESQRKRIVADLIAQVDSYSRWANGEVYRWAIEDEDGVCLDSCGGYNCRDYAWQEGLDALKEMAQTTRDFQEDFTTA